MLEDYKETQPIIYKILKKAITKNEYSHAYLFETNGFKDTNSLIMSFIKSLLCPKKNLHKDKCEKCHQCEVIDANNFPEIKIIKPDGLWIKKEQLKQLQSEFKEKAIIGDKRIYVINEAEKLNISAANSILKFLEEPEEGIIAIMITENAYNVLETIRSRCQILRLKGNTLNSKDMDTAEKIKNIIYSNCNNNSESTNKEQTDTLIDKSINFINYYEKKHLETLLYCGKLITDYIKTKEEMIDALEIMILYYKDILNIILKKQAEIFTINSSINIIIDHNSIEKICKKINILIQKKQQIKYNANLNLLLDKLIIDFEGGV